MCFNLNDYHFKTDIVIGQPILTPNHKRITLKKKKKANPPQEKLKEEKSENYKNN